MRIRKVSSGLHTTGGLKAWSSSESELSESEAMPGMSLAVAIEASMGEDWARNLAERLGVVAEGAETVGLTDSRGS